MHQWAVQAVAVLPAGCCQLCVVVCAQDHGALPERAVALIAYEVLQVSWSAVLCLFVGTGKHQQQRSMRGFCVVASPAAAGAPYLSAGSHAGAAPLLHATSSLFLLLLRLLCCRWLRSAMSWASCTGT